MPSELEPLSPLWLIGLSSVLAMIPMAIGAATSYLKISIVLSLLRSGIGAPQVPSIMITVVLSLALSGVIMHPVLSDMLTKGEKVMATVTKESTPAQLAIAFRPVLEPWNVFISKHTGARELEALERICPESNGKRSFAVRLLAFLVTELKSSFAIGVIVLIPFLVIDLVVANVLAGMGMMMMSPTLVALPLKIILFVLSDGWLLLTRSLILSYSV